MNLFCMLLFGGRCCKLASMKSFLQPAFHYYQPLLYALLWQESWKYEFWMYLRCWIASLGVHCYLKHFAYRGTCRPFSWHNLSRALLRTAWPQLCVHVCFLWLLLCPFLKNNLFHTQLPFVVAATCHDCHYSSFHNGPTSFSWNRFWMMNCIINRHWHHTFRGGVNLWFLILARFIM